MDILDPQQSPANGRRQAGPEAPQRVCWTDTLTALSDPSLDPLFWRAERLGSPSAWWQHVPFAHWIVCATAPRVLVELGTHAGVSYAAFCQAVVRAQLATRCHAVDTWRGDPQAGFYNDEVLDELRRFHDERFGAFSTLLQCTFDEALDHIDDDSVDLLHIDGMHTYEAVRHDFESWLPKLTDKAVVLFHDINERSGDFGVWRLWGELSRRYPAFEFVHGHGLGVLAVGGDAPAPVAALCELRAPVAIAMIRRRFARLGEHWWVETRQRLLQQDAGQHIAAASAEAELLRAEAARHSSEAARQRKEADELRAALARHSSEAGAARVAAEQAWDGFRAASARASQAEQQNAALRTRAEEAEARARLIEAEKREAVASAIAQAAETARALTQVQAERDGVLASTAWRATWPARTIGQRLPQGLRRAVRGSAQLGWWTVTMKLSSKLRERQAAHRAYRLSAGVRGAQGKDLAEPATSSLAPHSDMELIANSGLFDERFYLGTGEARAMGIGPIEHYVLRGEAAGFAPSPSFDPAFYRQRHCDVRGNRLVHYIRYGKDEGRSTRAAADFLDYPSDRLLPDRETVVVAVHEATRTGAPIIAWNVIGELRKRYNVVALLKSGGPIQQAIAEVSCATVTLPEDFVVHHAEIDVLALEIIRHYSPKYIIANSADTRYFVPSFERAGVPAVALIHEFSCNVRPSGTLHDLFKTASHIVFSAQIVAESALLDYPDLQARPFKVLAQGVTQPPPHDDIAAPEGSPARHGLERLLADDGSALVVGIGTINIRKGVEFFIATAASVQRRTPARKINFAWIGKCYSFDQPYLDYLDEQVKRSGVEASFAFLGELADLRPIYARADICFLSSRLDPLPAVAVEAAAHGIPVICFDRASGIAEILKTNDATRALVVPYLDSDAAARLVVEIAEDAPRRLAVSQAMRAIADQHFNMGRYVEAIDLLGCEAVRAREQSMRDHQLIARSGAFNVQLNLGPLAPSMTTDEAIGRYLHASRLVSPRGRPQTGRLVRRPIEGFHPLIYAAENAEYDEASGEDPLAHYLRTDLPAGRWQHEVIRPKENASATDNPLRVAVHGHFHYPDLLTDFLARLGRSRTAVDLFLTTTSSDRAATISQFVSRLNAQRATVTVVPNRGRDIGPLLSKSGPDMLAGYDVIGHFHGKRSPHVGASIGEIWRNFLWEHLIGGEHDMMGTIMEVFAADKTLGLVFAEDPHLNDWDENRGIADDLAARMGLPLPLPNHFDFPQGTMFWARPKALQPLIEVGLTWADYPDEPVPIDGTLMHALERLVPFSAAQAGYRYATTHLKGWVR